jgi:hypothetical protein
VASTLTVLQRQALIMAEVGDDGTANALITSIWAKATEAADGVALSTNPYYEDIQDGFAKVRSIDVLIGSVRGQFSMSKADRKMALRDKFLNLMQMREMAVTALAALVENTTSVAGAVVTEMTTVAPVASPTGRVDANAPVFRGDPNQWPWPI